METILTVLCILVFCNICIDLYKIKVYKKHEDLEKEIYKKLIKDINNRIFNGEAEDIIKDIVELISAAFNPDTNKGD